MSATGAAAFWSYSHEDDVLDGGAVVRLAQHLVAEYSLVTGESLELFLDRTGIEWGDEWRARIENALVSTTFFIPIVTPRYFTREECRKELLSFEAQARSLGVTDLILPILYATVSDLTADNPDQAVAVVARMQYEDWRSLRLAGANSAAYRQAVNGLAVRLVDVNRAITARQVEMEAQAAETSETESPDFQQAMARIGELLPYWLEAVHDDRVYEAQHDATMRAAQERLGKLRAGPAGARFAVLHRTAAHLLPIAENRLALAQVYSSRTIELNGLITTVVRIAADHPDVVPTLSELTAAVTEVSARIRESGDRLGGSTTDWAQSYSHISRAMSSLADMMGRADDYVREAGDLVLDWEAKLRELHGASGDAQTS